ncbi:MAG: hypothetical protein LBL39_05990 [Planctomycetaceae bacterium]|jgi:hypothetical protein|nr:hypothetical protein [Planctomycetaceae bacterium]
MLFKKRFHNTVFEVSCAILILAIVIFTMSIPGSSQQFVINLQGIVDEFNENNSFDDYAKLCDRNDSSIDTQLIGKWHTTNITNRHVYSTIHIIPAQSLDGRYFLACKTSCCAGVYTVSRSGFLDAQNDIIYMDSSFILANGKVAFNSLQIKRDDKLRPISIVPSGYKETPFSIFQKEYKQLNIRPI